MQAITKLVEKLISDDCTEETLEILENSGIVNSLRDVVCDPQNLNPQHMALCLRALSQICSQSRSVATGVCGSSLPQALEQILTIDMTASPQRDPQELIEAIKLASSLLPKEAKVNHPALEHSIDPVDYFDPDDDAGSEDSADLDIQEMDQQLSSKKPDESSSQKPVSKEDMARSKPLVEKLYPLCWRLLTARGLNKVKLNIFFYLIHTSFLFW